MVLQSLVINLRISLISHFFIIIVFKAKIGPPMRPKANRKGYKIKNNPQWKLH